MGLPMDQTKTTDLKFTIFLYTFIILPASKTLKYAIFSIKKSLQF